MVRGYSIQQHQPSLIKRKYDRQKQNEHYRKFCSDTRVFGVWDDNDYGMGDGNRTYKIKEKSREMLFEFLDIPEDSRERLHTGAYQSNTIIHGDKHIKIILLDVRYFKDPLKRDLLGNNRYIKDPHATILGEQQWDWLENELDTSTADIHIIGSGIQVIPEQHPFEKWADYPNERERFWSLLRKHDPKNPILISGDRHMAEVSQLRLSKNLTIFEMTSSGLTHTWENFSEEANKHRIGELYARKNFAILNIYSNSGVLKLSGELYQTDGKLLNTYDFH